MAPAMEEKKKRSHLVHDLALAVTEQVWVAPGMEKKRKQRHLSNTSDGREEEAGMPNPYTSSNCNRASIVLAAIARERMVPAMGNLSAVAPKIWYDLHLLRILTEGRRGSFLALSRRRNVLSLDLPCPDRAILSLEDTLDFWRGCGPFILILALTMSPLKAQSHW